MSDWGRPETKKRELRVVRTATGEVELVVDVTGKSDRTLLEVLIVMVHKLDMEVFHIVDSQEVDK